MGSFNCGGCELTFTYKSTLKRHVVSKHSDRIDELVPKRPCKTHFNEHDQQVSHWKCPLCEFSGREGKSDLLAHFSLKHNLEIVVTNFEFTCLDDFILWKERIERESKSSFVKKTSEKRNRYMYYGCHRSGYFLSRSKGRKRLRTQGSNKIGGYCPAGLCVKRLEEKFFVTYTETHVGHVNDLGHLFLTLKERKDIATLIGSQVPFESILDDIRLGVGYPMERLDLLTKLDLYNIERSFNLTSSVRFSNSSDWLLTYKPEVYSSDKCVLYYKARGKESRDDSCLSKEDFVLILMNSSQAEILMKYGTECVCIDCIHGTKIHNFELITILISDILRHGFPCAFMISNRSDREVLQLFFDRIKEYTGAINSKVLMTNMDDSYYEVWSQTMGRPEIKLFSPWHVDSNWRDNLCKIKSKEKQIVVYKMLRMMMEEIDQLSFVKMMDNFVTDLRSNLETCRFCDYFIENYKSSVHSWAHCFRFQAALVTIQFERMHLTIRNIFFKAKSFNNLNKTLNSLVTFIKDKLIDRLIVLHKGQLSKKIISIKESHRTVAEEACEDRVIIEVANGWKVASGKPLEENTVSDYMTDCRQCPLVCIDCNICIHRYSCTCPDNSLNWNICKHIHLISLVSACKNKFVGTRHGHRS